MQVDLSNPEIRRQLDIVFVLPPTEGAKHDFHYRSVFFMAVVSMVTGWEMDIEVGSHLWS